MPNTGIKLIECKPVRHQWARLNDTGKEVRNPVFNETPEGRDLNAHRQGLRYRDAAVLLGITQSELSGLETGRYRLIGADWTKANQTLDAARA